MSVDPLALSLWGFLPTPRRLEEAGHFWEARCIRNRSALKNVKEETTGQKDCGDQVSRKKSVDEDVAMRVDLFDSDGEKYLKFLLKLDPADCKDQDHYKVLGISKLRHNATLAEVRHAYRQKVLKHHPDKKKGRGETMANEEYFACITKAYEQIGMNEQKRRSYDSVDPLFDDAVPSANSVNKDNFFRLLSPVFERNMRWSNIHPVPVLGNIDSDRDHVETFYNFWFDFSSWREFSYLDEEDKEKGEDRWERREMEKLNKAERERRRKAEMKRIRGMVEMAYTKDPRVSQFKKDDQAAKERVKADKLRIVREKAAAEERKKKEEADEKKRLEDEAEKKAKEERDAEKNKKQEEKKRRNGQRRRLNKMAESAEWWADVMHRPQQIEKIERVCLLLTTDELTSLCDEIEVLKLDSDHVNDVFTQYETYLLIGHTCIEGIQKSKCSEPTKTASSERMEDKENDVPSERKDSLWSAEENSLLIKATNLYPAGTLERWRVVTEFVNEHRKDKSTKVKGEKEVIRQAKLVQSLGMKAVENIAAAASTVPAPEASWQPEEQKKLEEALRVVPTTDPERWTKISVAVGSKSKKECVSRFKYLAELVKKNRTN